MTEESAAPVDENMPPEVIPAAELETSPESAPAVENEDPGNEPAAEQSEEEVPENVQKRINKVTADKHAERRRAEKAEARILELEGAPPAEVPEPKLEDFDFDESKYNAALIKYEVQKATKDTVSNYKAEQDGLAEKVRFEENSRLYNERAAKIKETITDFDQVINNLEGIKFPAQTFDAMFQAEDGPQIAYYLGKHLDLAEEIATASPTVAGIKLGELSAQLAIVKPTKQPSAAPDPIEPVTSGGTLNKNQEDMSMEEIMALPNTR